MGYDLTFELEVISFSKLLLYHLKFHILLLDIFKLFHKCCRKIEQNISIRKDERLPSCFNHNFRKRHLAFTILRYASAKFSATKINENGI